MSAFARLAPEEQLAAYQEAAQRKNVLPVIVEKDFWVCWLLGHIFASAGLGGQCVFKGGTSLSKVFAAIDRFSEDIDLGLTPASLGWSEADLDDAPSPTQRRKRMEPMFLSPPPTFEEMLATLREAEQGLNAP